MTSDRNETKRRIEVRGTRSFIKGNTVTEKDAIQKPILHVIIAIFEKQWFLALFYGLRRAVHSAAGESASISRRIRSTTSRFGESVQTGSVA